jgi:flagellar motility protein MotE (MotC chaperone)
MSKRTVRRRGVLQVISSLLVLSGLIRLTVGGQEAFANSHAEVEQTLSEVSADSGAPSEDLISALQARAERLSEREGKMADRQQALNVAEVKIAEQLSALQAAETSLAATIALADTASESDLEKLTIVYEKMAPKDAAALFEQMPPPFAAGFLGMMEPTAAAKIMAGLTPETAYSFSVMLAGRNALVPSK